MRGLAILAITLANLIGGATYLAQKIALAGLPAATVTLLRTLIAMACMAAWVAFTGGFRLRFSARELRRLALLGVLAFALPTLLGIVGLRWSTAGNGSAPDVRDERATIGHEPADAAQWIDDLGHTLIYLCCTQ